MMIRWRWLVLLAVVFFVWFALSGGISLYLDLLWFESVGYASVFRTVLGARFICMILGMLLSAGILGLNLWLSSRRPLGVYRLKHDFIEIARTGSGYVFWLVVLAFSLILGLIFQARWLDLFRFWYQVPAEIADPVFSRDLSFYFFSLPVLELAARLGMALVALSFLIAAVSYVIHGHLSPTPRLRLSESARIHLTVLASLFFFMLAVLFWLRRFDLLFSAEGIVYGAGYADLHASLPCYWILCGVSLLTALLLLASIPARTLRLALYSALGFTVAYLLLTIYPSLVQTLLVGPNELEMEAPYIAHHIAETRRAYRLDGIETLDFTVQQNLVAADLETHRDTLSNIRLWDWRPLKDAYNQLQSIRLYYDFEDVDIDRYVINGTYRQVMLSMREFNFERIAPNAQNWINRHFLYTHGYGICMSPVNEVTEEGLPSFFIQDIPPISHVDLEITRPGIYFGEKTDYPVFVRTALREFDFPRGDDNATTIYEADRGIPINSFFMKALFAWEFGIYQILFTDYFTEDSRVLMHRGIRERISRIAPFLLYDEDPYPVLLDGRLVWIQDAYTVTARYPYSVPYRGGFNYIRNSIKVVLDAYTGDVDFYISDPEDPLIRTLSRVFPSLFKPLSETPSGLAAHLRYPEDFFNVQRDIFRTFHMEDPRDFYNREDLWEIPSEIYRGNEQQMDSYYVVMNLLGSEQEEFVLLIPFTPKNKNNMIAWLAARSDGENYGKLVLYRFPKQELTYGPMQIEARIDQNPEISQLITLWSQKGSQVIRGNLLVIPVGESILYVEPLYLQAEKSEIPELTRVIVVYGNRVSLGLSLWDAIERAVLGRSAPPMEFPGELTAAEPEAPESDTVLPASEDVPSLIRAAAEHYRRSQEHLRQGNWSAYGEEQRKLGAVLDRLAGQ